MEKHYPLPRDEVKSVREAIQKIRYENIEHLYVFKNGKQFRRYIGEESYVNLPLEYLFELKDTDVVHNHPTGNTFSIDDVYSAVNYNLKGLIVVTTQFIYSIKRPETGWDINFEDEFIQYIMNSCEKNAREMVEKHVTQFQIIHEEKEILFLHFLWVFFFNMFNIEYAKKEHPKYSI
ncbi:hypothetical protein [Anditalea andensis]|uniref:Uncharacterized protein n=1 Tax=Anditalea andensis TaxID=1048983 RepID=A0A074L400_9BACT|nr:hypothetical protein [Anditalea andensis]KEO75929.1 hypothetical protein EL17_10970 [Anditalea andensis]